VRVQKVQVMKVQLILSFIIVLLLSVIVLPAWKTVQIRAALQSGEESGSTLAERYLLLGDWPSGQGQDVLAHYNEFAVQAEARKPIVAIPSEEPRGLQSKTKNEEH